MTAHSNTKTAETMPAALGIAGRILLACLAAGIAGDGLLRAGPIGVNVLLWVFLLSGLALWLARKQPVMSRRDDGLAAAAMILCAAAFAWRTDPRLLLFELFAMGAILALAMLRQPLSLLTQAGGWSCLQGIWRTGFSVAVGPLALVGEDIAWRDLAHERGWRRGLPVVIGIVIALPLLLIFGGLLALADPVFASWLRALAPMRLPVLISHLVLIVFFAWITAGYLRGVLLRPPLDLPAVWQPRRAPVGARELGVALWAVNLLFLAFVMAQFRYFFGGSHEVMVTHGLTYAAYARQGFFALFAVAALVGPLLLVMAELQKYSDAPRSSRLAFRVPARVMLGLVFIIMASALARMRFYEQAYGLTERRMYATLFMFWLGAVLFWLAITVLRGRRGFLAGVFASGLVLAWALPVMNPAGLVARVDLARAARGQKMDAGYLAGLGPDAMPVLAAGLPRLPLAARCAALRDMRTRWQISARFRHQADWRTWNVARQSGWRLEKSALGSLPGLGCGKALVVKNP